MSRLTLPLDSHDFRSRVHGCRRAKADWYNLSINYNKSYSILAQQEAERARYVVEKTEQEKLAAIIRAEGESQAAELISQALQKAGPGHVELRRIEAAKDIATTMAKAKNVTYLPSGKSGANMLLKVD